MTHTQHIHTHLYKTIIVCDKDISRHEYNHTREITLFLQRHFNYFTLHRGDSYPSGSALAVILSDIIRRKKL